MPFGVLVLPMGGEVLHDFAVGVLVVEDAGVVLSGLGQLGGGGST